MFDWEANADTLSRNRAAAFRPAAVAAPSTLARTGSVRGTEPERLHAGPGRRPDHEIVDPAVGITGFRQGCGEAFAECGAEPFEPFFGGAVDPDGPGTAAFQFVELGDQAVEFRYGSGSGKVFLKPDHVRQKGLGTFPATVQRNPGGDGKEDCGGPADGPAAVPAVRWLEGLGRLAMFRGRDPVRTGDVPQSRMRT